MFASVWRHGACLHPRCLKLHEEFWRARASRQSPENWHIAAQEEQRTVYVGNVTASVDEGAMRSVFDTCGPVLSVRMAGCGPPFAHVFSNPSPPEFSAILLFESRHATLIEGF